MTDLQPTDCTTDEGFPSDIDWASPVVVQIPKRHTRIHHESVWRDKYPSARNYGKTLAWANTQPIIIYTSITGDEERIYLPFRLSDRFTNALYIFNPTTDEQT